MTNEEKEIREQFPLLSEYPDLAYLDNAATTQKPASVIEVSEKYYKAANANPLRGLYDLSQKATDVYENARESVREFINAKSTEEIVFTRNATESLNLVAYSGSEVFLKEGDEILITIMEHHSNLLPWQQAAKRRGAKLNFLECDEKGKITEETFRAALTDQTKVVAMTQISNVLGVKNEIKLFAKIAHEKGAIFIADGAQSVPHIPVDVQNLDVDFLSFSGHKMLAPMGIGVLYGKKEHFEKMPPFLYGGEMIEYVTRESATYAELPHKFEAGTVNASGAAGLDEAIQFYKKIGWDTIIRREDELSEYAMEKLSAISEVHILGSDQAKEHHGIFTFTVDGVHPHDIAAILDADQVAIRAGHHCAQPLMKFMGTPSTARASIAFYNTKEEIDRLAESVSSLRKRMGYGV
jgi:cysteine desulfurase / selenocysteine lyase